MPVSLLAPIAERRLGEVLEASNLLPFVSRIVFEITERQALDERGREAIRRGRKLGDELRLTISAPAKAVFSIS